RGSVVVPNPARADEVGPRAARTRTLKIEDGLPADQLAALRRAVDPPLDEALATGRERLVDDDPAQQRRARFGRDRAPRPLEGATGLGPGLAHAGRDPLRGPVLEPVALDAQIDLRRGGARLRLAQAARPAHRREVDPG